MPLNKHSNTIIEYLKGMDSFTNEDIRTWFNHHGIEASDENLRVRIHRLKTKGVLQKVARGRYTFNQKPNYTSVPDNFIKKVNRTFLAKYQGVDYCIWSTKRLQDLMHHIPVKSFYVLETEKDVTETIFYHLKDNRINAYYHPSQDQVYKYVVPEDDAIIVKPIVSRSPCFVVENVRMPGIEKILVDLYCDTQIYYAYGGSELIKIYENALTQFTINYSTLLRYAERRKKNIEIRAFLLDHFDYVVKNILT